jgi:hypothetical protein
MSVWLSRTGRGQARSAASPRTIAKASNSPYVDQLITETLP